MVPPCASCSPSPVDLSASSCFSPLQVGYVVGVCSLFMAVGPGLMVLNKDIMEKVRVSLMKAHTRDHCLLADPRVVCVCSVHLSLSLSVFAPSPSSSFSRHDDRCLLASPPPTSSLVLSSFLLPPSSSFLPSSSVLFPLILPTRLGFLTPSSSQAWVSSSLRSSPTF